MKNGIDRIKVVPFNVILNTAGVPFHGVNGQNPRFPREKGHCLDRGTFGFPINSVETVWPLKNDINVGAVREPPEGDWQRDLANELQLAGALMRHL